MKVTEEQKQQIKQWTVDGMNSYEIAKKLGLHQPTVYYWLCDRGKRIKYALDWQKKLSIVQKKERYEKSKAYNAKYFKDRYWSDEVFREKHKERCRKKR